MDEINQIIQEYRQYNWGLRLVSLELANMEESERLDRFNFYEEHFLRSDRGIRITEDTKKGLVSSTFPNDVEKALKSYPPFKSVRGEQFSTYLLTRHGGENFGAVYRIIPVSLDANASQVTITNPDPAFIRGLVEDYLNQILPSNKYFIADKETNQKIFKLIDAFGFEPGSSVKVEGRSSSLPVFILYLSLITGIPIPVDIALTGDVDPGLNIRRVDGIKEKIEALRLEYPEVKKLVVPENNIFEIGESFADLQLIAANTVDEAVRTVFGDSIEVLARLSKGVIRFEKTRREVQLNDDTNKKYKATFFSLVAEEYPMNIPPKILRKLDLAKETAEAFTEDQGIYILDNVRPLWYASFLAGKFFNKASVYATVNTGVRKHAIVVYCKEESGFRPGDALYFEPHTTE